MNARQERILTTNRPSGARLSIFVTFCFLSAFLPSLLGCNPAATRGDQYLVSNLAEKYTRHGDKLAAENRLAEALLAYRQAVLADPSYSPGLQRLANAYAAQGQRRLAVRLYEKILATNPQDNNMARLAHREAASLYSQLGDQAKATAHLQSLVALGDPDAQKALADLSASSLPKPALAPRWQARLEQHGEVIPGENVPSGLAFSEGTLYVTTQEGMLYALDATTGKERWRFDTGSTGSKRRVTSAPVVAGSTVLFGADDNFVRALSASDGTLLWRFETKAQVFGAPAVDANTVYAASADGNLYAFSLSDGSLKWQYNAGEAMHVSPHVADNVVYVGTRDGRLHAVSAATGKALWTFPTAGNVESVPVTAGDKIYFGSDDSRLYALNRQKGALSWYYSTGDAVYATPLLAKGVVYVASMGNVLAALATEDGKVLWEYFTDTPLRFAPLLHKGRLYLTPANSPLLYVLDAATGALLEQQDTGEWPACQPILANDTIYLAQRDGTIMALGLNALPTVSGP